MSWKGIYKEKPFISKLLIFAGLCLLCLSVFTILGFGLAAVIFQLDLLKNPNILSHYEQQNVINALKLIQTFSAVGMFIIPSIISCWIFSAFPKEYIYIRVWPSLLSAILVSVILFAAVPLINWLSFINQQMTLPSFLTGIEEWMKASEEQAKLLTEAFLKTDSTTGLISNLIMIGLIPAIGEELFFRGILQRILSDSMKNKHLPILISAIIFSALHMQFYGFIPRMLLGILLGYFLRWSHSLWLPILGHFVNNAAAVLFSFYAAKEGLPFDQDNIGTEPGDQLYLFSSFLVVAVCLLLLYKKANNKKRIRSTTA